MQVQSLKYSCYMTPAFFAGASHDDVKWTINYLIGLLEVPDNSRVMSNVSVEEARRILRKRKLESHHVPSDFNGMRG